MKTTLKIAVIAMMGMSLGVSAQDQTVNGKLTVNGNIDSGEYLNLVNKGVRHSIFNYSGNSNFYFGAGKDSEGNKKEMIFYNYSCNGGCNVPRIQLLTDILYTPGQVGIGTTNLGEWKLAVNGKIRAKEIKVETDWSDFVFEKDYNLPNLKEVESHIKEKGHLKDIPSAKEVKENGIFLGEMDAKLLQKIEELTLYTIQQEKKITEQANEIKELKLLNIKLLELQKRLEKLEKK